MDSCRCSEWLMSKGIVKLLAAAALYAGFAVYLYQPYFGRFAAHQFLIGANAALAALGCFVLSRRWVGSFAGSFFAGAIYGFGPLMLWLNGFHFSIGSLAAAIGWLFCPAAFVPRTRRWNWPGWLLCALPFAAIVLFFELSAGVRLFAMPIQPRLHPAALLGLVAPLVAAQKAGLTIGFYHVPVAAVLMGMAMLISARRFGIMLIFVLGIIGAFRPAFLNVSPLIWLTIPTLCCAGLIGAGLQGLISAGAADKKIILAIALVMAGLSIVMLLSAAGYFQAFAEPAEKPDGLLTLTAGMYILAAVAVAFVFFLASAKLRAHPLRLAILCSAMALDIFLSARFIVDKVF